MEKNAELNMNFCPLDSKDEYAKYMNQLCKVFELLIKTFVYQAEQQSGVQQNIEAVIVSEFLNKIMFTVQALRIKYEYNPNHELKIDLTDSGLPGILEIQSLPTDLLMKNERLIDLPTTKSLKQSILDYIFKYKRDPEELLWRMSERVYFEMIDERKLLLPFTPGTLKMMHENGRYRHYIFSWCCYDFKTNMPYIHIMVFDQDIESAPLENRDLNYRQFIDVVKSEGSRAPGVAVIATGIDMNLDDIHPKVIKRICIGPICTAEYSKNPEDLCELLKSNRRNGDDFIALFKDEIVFSSEQKISKGFFSHGKVREIFHIPETDQECYENKASQIHHYMLIPHTVLQHLRLGRYNKYEKIPYTMEGGVYVTE